MTAGMLQVTNLTPGSANPARRQGYGVTLSETNAALGGKGWHPPGISLAWLRGPHTGWLSSIGVFDHAPY
jgi:hypothetical protein